MKKIVALFVLSIMSVCFADCNNQTDEGNTGNDSICLSEYMSQAWDVTWARFYYVGTQQFYDYLSSYEDGHGLDHLPNKKEVTNQYPNFQGYDTGMEDCMISAGVILCMIIDKYEITKDEELKNYAFDVFQGIKRSATIHGVPGFLARCVCVEDSASIYINSSRDQYTHAVHSLWHYYHSSLSDFETKEEIGILLSAIADRMKQNVTPENNYDFLRADGTHDTRGISKMWDVKGHEAARLPMIYAAAWNTTGKTEYFDLYREYIEPAINQSLEIEEWQPTYALLQMQSSIELLLSLEQDLELKNKMGTIMEFLAHLAEKRAINANKNAQSLDLTMVGSDWRTGEGLKSSGEYRKVWYCIRESGEAALTQLIFEGNQFPNEQVELLDEAIRSLDYKHVSSSGIFYLQAAYWKAVKNGIFNIR